MISLFVLSVVFVDKMAIEKGCKNVITLVQGLYDDQCIYKNWGRQTIILLPLTE